MFQFNKAQKEVYLPLEFFSRELFAKILLSTFFLKNKYTVYIGSHSSIDFFYRFKKRKNGTVILKGGITDDNLKIYKKKFSNIVILDEEISPEIKNKKKMERRINKNLMKSCSLYLCSDQKSYNYSKKIKHLSKKAKFTGWPRFDLAKKQSRHIFGDKTIKIKEKYKKFFLINSDFKYINKIAIIKEIKKIKKIYKEFEIDTSTLIRQINIQKLRSQENLSEFKDFKKLFLDIAIKNTKYNFLLRAHPTEDVRALQNYFNNYNNIYVLEPKDDVHPYIFSSLGVLHRGCTTAYQSLLSNKHTAWLSKNKYENNHKKILMQNSFRIKNERDFSNWVKKIDKSTSKPTNSFKKLLFKNIKFLSSELIVKEVNKLQDQKVNYNLIFIMKLRFYFILRKLKYILNTNKEKKNPYSLKKINLKSILKNFMKKQNIRIHVSQISENLYVLKR